MAVCYIAGASPVAERIRPLPGDFLIAADGGLTHLARWGLTPDLLVGDLDSLETAPGGIPCLKHPRKKDDTDLSLALDEAIARGFRHIMITGAWGGRPDHCVGNLQLLVKAARQGFFVQMLCGDFIATAITDSQVLHLNGSGTVSVFAWGGQARGVSLRGLEYPLENAILQDNIPLGISNTLEGEGKITLEHGALLVFYEEGIELCVIA